MSNQPRKTSNIVKRVDDVEETIPDYYGPQDEEPSGEFKKGDMWFVDGEEVRAIEPDTPKRTRPLREVKHPKKIHKLFKKGKR
mgnify:CR=1 FL=1